MVPPTVQAMIPLARKMVKEEMRKEVEKHYEKVIKDHVGNLPSW